MVATVRCEEIANEKFFQLTMDEVATSFMQFPCVSNVPFLVFLNVLQKAISLSLYIFP